MLSSIILTTDHAKTIQELGSPILATPHAMKPKAIAHWDANVDQNVQPSSTHAHRVATGESALEVYINSPPKEESPSLQMKH